VGVQAARRHRDVRTFGGEALRDRRSDPAARARHERHATLQRAGHRSPIDDLAPWCKRAQPAISCTTRQFVFPDQPASGARRPGHDGSGCDDCGGWNSAGAAAVGLAAGTAIGAAGASVASANAYAAGVAAGRRAHPRPAERVHLDVIRGMEVAGGYCTAKLMQSHGVISQFPAIPPRLWGRRAFPGVLKLQGQCGLSGAVGFGGNR
jgi:hypothetical protein